VVEVHFLYFHVILDAFAKLRKATISFIMSVHPSVCPHRTARLALNGFSWNSIVAYFSIIVYKILVPLKLDKSNGYLTWCPIYTFIISHSILLIMRNVSNKYCRENQNTHFMFNNFFSPKIVPFMRQYGKILYSQAGHRRQYGACALHAWYLRLQTHSQNM
jgi:hypothetical protein